MSKRNILITIDEESMGDDWDHVDAYCAVLSETIGNEYSNADVEVRPELDSVNGGRVELGGDWDGYAREDGVREVIKHWQNEIFSSGAYKSNA